MMGLEINRLSKGDGDMSDPKFAAARVYRTVDGEFVGEGDPRGAYLAYGVGAEIPAGDAARYDAFMSNTPQDALDSQSHAALAYTDEGVRDNLRRRQAGDPTARTPLNEPPVLVHDRLATELADEARIIASAPPETIAAARNDMAGDAVYATRAIWRTADGDLVNEGDENGATLAYPVGAKIADADLDEFNDLEDPADDETPDDETPAAKQAKKPANKAAPKPADK